MLNPEKDLKARIKMKHRRADGWAFVINFTPFSVMGCG